MQLRAFDIGVTTRFWLRCLIGLALVCVCFFLNSGVRPRRAQGSAAAFGAAEGVRPDYLNSNLGVAHTGSKVCATCHAQIYMEFSQTHMGRSMSLPINSANLYPIASSPVFDGASHLYYQVTRKGMNIYQSVYGLGDDGEETFRHTERLAFAIGSGVNAVGFIVRRGDYLFQAPLAFYEKTRTWDLAPGYRGHDIGFSRAISTRCIACHSGIPQPISGRTGLFSSTPFQELAIGCENCHGPGQLHVKAHQSGEQVSPNEDRTIVNPAALPTWLASNICMSCHEDGDAQVLKPGKDFLDIRPGIPLDDVVALFKLRPTSGSAPQSELLDRNGEMISSKCYDSSGGRLNCLTCHEPHHEPPPQEAAAYYRDKCLSCHTDQSCGLPLKIRREGMPPNDCVGCHMLKQDLRLPHSSITNHRIVVTRDEPTPEFLIRPVASGPPGLIHLDAIVGAENAPPSLITLLQAYRQVALSTKNPNYVEHYLTVLDRLAITQPDNPVVLSALAQRAALGGTPGGMDKAIQFLNQALASGSNDQGDHLLLGELLASRHRPSEAIVVLRGSLLLYPYYVPYCRLLADSYISIGDLGRAREVIKQGLQQSPESRILREFQEKLGEGRGSP